MEETAETIEIVTYRCDKCGLQSTIQEAFLIKGKTLCFPCAIKKQARSLAQTMLLLLGFGVFYSLIFPGSWLARLYLQMFAGLLMALPLIVVHELAHALTAWLVGLRAFVIHLGAGPVLANWLFLGMKWTLHAFPVSGATVLAGRPLRFYQARKFLTVLAGPAVHAVLMVVLLWIWRNLPPGANPWLAEGLVVCAGTNAFLFVTNLLPKKEASPVGAASTDGQAMVNILKGEAGRLDKEFSFYYLLQAIAAAEREKFPAAQAWIMQGMARDPQDPHMLNGLGYVHMSQLEAAPAREAFLRLHALGDALDQQMKTIALNNIAFANVILRDPALLEEALAFSEQAYRNMSWEPTVILARGAALIWAGQLEEGEALVHSAMRQQPMGRARSVHHCFLAIAAAKRGDHAQAQKLLGKARRLERKSKVVEWAEKALRNP